MKKGISTLITVFLVSMVSLLVIVGWQSRLILAVQRQQSLSDLLTVNYKAESEVYDYISRIINYGYMPSDGSSEVAVDGLRKLLFDVKTAGAVQTIDVSATWPYASTKLRLSRITSTSSTPAFEKAEILLGLDCSSSMGEFANASQPTEGKRIRALQKALQSFLKNVDDLPDRDKFYIGLIPFRMSANWAFGYTQPENKAAELFNYVKDSSFGGTDWTEMDKSNLCKTNGIENCPLGAGNCYAATNLGSAGILASTYFKDHPVDTSKVLRTYVVFTDGFPNTSNNDSSCSAFACSRPENTGFCQDTAINYLKCGLAKNGTDWTDAIGASKPGRMPGDVKKYSVTVAGEPGCITCNEKSAFIETNKVFNSTQYVDKSFANSNANQLANIFDDIFNIIVTNAEQFKIRKVIPTPLP